MRPSLYRLGVDFHNLESCFPQNKGLRDKIRRDLNFPRTIIDWQSDHALLAVRPPAPGYARLAKTSHQHKGVIRELVTIPIIIAPIIAVVVIIVVIIVVVVVVIL
jgi:hypothetical protein